MSAPAIPRCYRHPDRETYISCVRCGRPICPDCMRPAAVGFQCPDEIKAANRSVRPKQGVFGGRVSRGAPAVTYTLIGLNVAAFLALALTGAGRLISGLFNSTVTQEFVRLAEVPGRLQLYVGSQPVAVEAGVANGDWYRLVTSMFLHFGILHLALNMISLYVLGPPVERILGWVRFTAVYFLAGIGGSVASFLFAGPTTVGAGASGAIFGLLGAFFVVARKVNAPTGPILSTVGLNLVLSFAIPGISYQAHIGGLVVGALTTAIIVYAPRERRAALQAAGLVVTLAVLIGLTVLRAQAIRDQERNQPPAAVRIDALSAGYDRSPTAAAAAPTTAAARPAPAPAR